MKDNWKHRIGGKLRKKNHAATGWP